MLTIWVECSPKLMVTDGTLTFEPSCKNIVISRLSKEKNEIVTIAQLKSSLERLFVTALQRNWKIMSFLTVRGKSSPKSILTLLDLTASCKNIFKNNQLKVKLAKIKIWARHKSAVFNKWSSEELMGGWMSVRANILYNQVKIHKNRFEN